ncbi:Tetratricopeptide-like helical [Corchorus olitorius]|uniref:Tetratricopeptide-like helical n=1 Tax=Corchorus olitorius TaxID=93759 RepID=A0A1R3JWU9_9ROSI|nr:Tetratricopeptide-like helical [Corchorus olitorius]
MDYLICTSCNSLFGDSGFFAATILGVNFNYVLAEDVSIQTSSGSDVQGADIDGLRKVEDGSGKLEQAERFFLSALQEAKEGFGERDSHVASSCNNLAELYRVKKAFDKAEPLYLEAISILEEAFGSEDIRVGVALHNLGQFYLVQRKLEEAQMSYEVKRRVLGLNNIDYADTMYHLGMVLYLQGKLKDSEALMQDSVRILEEGGQGESMACIRRLRYLVQGWDSLDTVIAAEGLALTLQSSGSLKEAQELFERCLGVRKTLLPEDHIQIGANMLHLARVIMLNCNQHWRMHVSEAIAELDKAKDLLNNSIRIAGQVIYKLERQKGKNQNNGLSGRDGREALIILLQSLDALGVLEINRQELQEPGVKVFSSPEAKNAHFECISAYKELASGKLIGDSPEVKAAYLSCLRHLLSLLDAEGTQKYRGTTLQELKDEMKGVELDISSYRGSKN